MAEKKSTEADSSGVEQCMARLETLVTEMEDSKLPLETLITRYEEGLKLIRQCQEKLDAAEKKIQVITRNASGPTGVEDFPTGSNES